MNAIVALATHLRELPRSVGNTGGRTTRIRIGEKYGDWTVTKYIPGSYAGGKRKKPACVCKCSCGTVRNVAPHSLTSGRSKSCGHDTGGRPPEVKA